MVLFSRKPKGDARAWFDKGALYDNQGDAENAKKCKDKAKELGFHDG